MDNDKKINEEEILCKDEKIINEVTIEEIEIEKVQKEEIIQRSKDRAMNNGTGDIDDFHNLKCPGNVLPDLISKPKDEQNEK